VRDLCLDARDKFMPSEISNLIVYFFPGFMATAFFYVHESARGNNNLPFKCCSWETLLCKWVFFFLCVCEKNDNSSKLFVGEYASFQPNWLINYCFEESPT